MYFFCPFSLLPSLPHPLNATDSAMHESEGKETINPEMTSDIIVAHPPTYRQACNIHNHRKRRFRKSTQLNSGSPNLLYSGKEIHDINLESSQCDLVPTSCFSLSRKEKSNLVYVAFKNIRH